MQFDHFSFSDLLQLFWINYHSQNGRKDHMKNLRTLTHKNWQTRHTKKYQDLFVILTHIYYRLRHVTITPTQLKTKLLGSETCKWYVFVVSFAGPLSYILVCVKAGSAMQLVVKPHQLMVKENRLAYMIAKSVGTLLFSKCCKAIPNSFEASPAKTSTAHNAGRGRPSDCKTCWHFAFQQLP